MVTLLRTLFWLFLIFLSVHAQAADFYWRGGSGNFNDFTQWELNAPGSNITPAQLPLSSDNVFFPAGTNGVTITIDQPSNCQNMTWDPAATATLVGGGNLTLTGSMTLSSGCLWEVKGDIIFISGGNAGTRTINTNGVQLRVQEFIIDLNAGDILQLQGDLDIDDATNGTPSTTNLSDAGGVFTLNRGGFDSNEYTIYTDYLHSTSDENSRELMLEESDIFLRGRIFALLVDFNTNTSNFTTFRWI